MIKKIVKSLLPPKIRNNLTALRYYHRLGITQYFFRDKLRYLLKRRASDTVKLIPQISHKIKILYLYNIEGWAVQNVGKLWLSAQAGVETTFLRLNTSLEKDKDKFEEIRPEDYDFVWFGYLLLYSEFRKRYRRSLDFNKIIVTIHDPMELFPVCRDWKEKGLKEELGGRGQLLKELKKIAVVSKELQSKLLEYGVNAHWIPTMSLIPPVEKGRIKTKKCDILSVSGGDPRKNFQLLDSIKKDCKDKNIKVKLHDKTGTDYLLPMDTYMLLIDNHEIYICTSFMEGGPLPAMDAMNRGAVVLTTPVGQMLEIIEDGKNGFICKSRDEFVGRIEYLSKNLDVLHRMRIASRDAICEKRNPGMIHKRVSSFLGI